MMDARSLDFFKRLLDAPGPSGFERVPARLWREEAATFAKVEADVAGNCYATVNPGGKPRVMLTGHLDEIGVMVVHVDDDGFLYFAPIGGWDPQVLVGQRVRLEGRAGPVAGVVGKKAIHLIKAEEREKASKISDLWIDIGARTKAEALERIRVGDAGVLASGITELPNRRLVSRSIDNRVGSFVVLEALRRLAAQPPAACAVAVGTTQEEIAYTGGGARTSAFGLEPDAAIVVDVTHATDSPGVEKKEVGDFKLGGGPVLSRGSAASPVVFDQLVAAAEAEQIPYGIEAAPRGTSTDADAIYTARRGIATGVVSVPCRYMHSPNEMVDLDDLDRAAGLLAAWVRRLVSGTSFLPY
ncbi:MAG TPA: M42 family metallopeptidase [Gemmatimonadales bacterium]|nr:M42 family metallopeptidase [Gemmatimonadales bacterium]